MRRDQTSGVWMSVPMAEVDDEPIVALPEPLRFILMHATRTDGSVWPLGAVWLNDSGDDGGFLPARAGGWLSEEMQRSYDGAIARGWTPSRIFEYWERRAAGHDDVIVDAPEGGDDLDDVRRILDT